MKGATSLQMKQPKPFTTTMEYSKSAAAWHLQALIFCSFVLPASGVLSHLFSCLKTAFKVQNVSLG